MILNKSSVDRGFAHATLYKTDMIDLRDKGSTTQRFQAEGGEAKPFVKREAGNLVRCVIVSSKHAQFWNCPGVLLEFFRA